MSVPLGAISLKQIHDAVEIRTCCESWYMKCIKLKHVWFDDSEHIPKKYMILGEVIHIYTYFTIIYAVMLMFIA